MSDHIPLGDRMAGVEIPKLTSDEIAFVKQWYGDYSTGRRMMCWVFRCLVALGAVGAAITAIIGSIVTIVHMAKFRP